jgi:hypothetical protein
VAWKYRPSRKILIAFISFAVVVSYAGQVFLKNMLATYLSARIGLGNILNLARDRMLRAFISADEGEIRAWIFLPTELWQLFLSMLGVLLVVGVAALLWQSRRIDFKLLKAELKGQREEYDRSLDAANAIIRELRESNARLKEEIQQQSAEAR